VTEPDSSHAWDSYPRPRPPGRAAQPRRTDRPGRDRHLRAHHHQPGQQQLRTHPGHGRTFDLAHLNAIHRQRFADVYPFAGQPRHVDLAKPGQTGEPFVHHAWIGTYVAAVAGQLSAEDSLRSLDDPSRWADRAGYYWAAPTHAHPYREGNGRTVRVWLGELAQEAGHDLDWRRASVERNTHIARAAAEGNVEPRGRCSPRSPAAPSVSTVPAASSTTSTGRCAPRRGPTPG
jgi:fido (protein-threonine AMPylation protein)